MISKTIILIFRLLFKAIIITQVEYRSSVSPSEIKDINGFENAEQSKCY